MAPSSIGRLERDDLGSAVTRFAATLVLGLVGPHDFRDQLLGRLRRSLNARCLARLPQMAISHQRDERLREES
jgi:hypothetical protein